MTETMAFQVVSLITALLVTSAWSQGFPPLGGYMDRTPNYGYGGYGYQNQQEQVDPYLLTCINADAQDVHSQIRLSIRPMSSGRVRHPSSLEGLGFGAFGGPEFDRDRDWTVDGVLLPSQLVQKMGSYQVAVFEGGRTFGECKMSALGQVLTTSRRRHPMMGMGLGPFSPFSMGLSPFSSMFGGMYGQQREPSGTISNPAVVSTGTTMYSGIIRRVSYYDLVGRSVGVCQTIQGGQCYGTIPYCCSITRDALPASEVYLDPISQTQQVGLGTLGGLNQGNLVGGQPGIGAATLPLPGATATAVTVGDSNGLF